MLNCKAIIFDLDDTLFDETEYVKSGYRAVSRYLSCYFGSDAADIFNELYKLFMQSHVNVFNRYLDLKGLIGENFLLSECISIYRNHSPDISLRDNVRILLDWLVEKKYLLGIITDGRPEGQRKKIEALGLSRYMRHVIVTDELGGIEFRKPCKIPYNFMLDRLGVAASEAIYVGDNPTKDFVTANEIGMSTVMLRNPNSIHSQDILEDKYKPKFIIDNLLQIKKMLVGDE